VARDLRQIARDVLPPTAMTIDLNHARFLISAHRPSQWPADSGVEVAFVGRSNVGKSSAINVITARRGLARTSKTPGRTQQLVFFTLDASTRFVDLPGYGYAKVPLKLKRHWQSTVERYLTERRSLRGLVIPMDARRPLLAFDRQLLAWCAQTTMPVHILLSKADKLSKSRQAAVLHSVRDAVAGQASVQLFSATTRAGVEDARSVVRSWLADATKKAPGEGEEIPGAV